MITILMIGSHGNYMLMIQVRLGICLARIGEGYKMEVQGGFYSDDTKILCAIVMTLKP
jgi:hypothetical protein